MEQAIGFYILYPPVSWVIILILLLHLIHDLHSFRWRHLKTIRCSLKHSYCYSFFGLSNRNYKNSWDKMWWHFLWWSIDYSINQSGTRCFIIATSHNTSSSTLSFFSKVISLRSDYQMLTTAFCKHTLLLTTLYIRQNKKTWNYNSFLPDSYLTQKIMSFLKVNYSQNRGEYYYKHPG